MRRRFIAKTHRTFPFFIKIFLLVILGIFILSKIMSFKLFNSNSNMIMYIMELSNHLVKTELSCDDKIHETEMILMNMDIKRPVTLFQNNFIYKNKQTILSTSKIIEVINNFLNTNYIVNDNNQELVGNIEDALPRVYIYNTHQTEEYVFDNSEIHNITPNVFTAANLLKDLLEQKGIKTIVENGNISEYLINNGLNYDDSYIASRHYLIEAMNKYHSVELFIDFHRDALTHDISTVNYDGKEYAKILFVVGLDHDDYQKNIEFTNQINNLFLAKYPFLTRGILEKSGPLVNGIYNQDLSEKVILLEVGGNENNFEEVTNTVELISEIISEKIGDNDV